MAKICAWLLVFRLWLFQGAVASATGGTMFITKFHVRKVRHLENLDIALSETERKHLIITGVNGSGKTSLLEALRDSVALSQRSSILGSRNSVARPLV
jgi:type IV secretory pathway VirB4 component